MTQKKICRRGFTPFDVGRTTFLECALRQVHSSHIKARKRASYIRKCGFAEMKECLWHSDSKAQRECFAENF